MQTSRHDYDWNRPNAFYEAADCHICGKTLDNYRVRDHCHITYKY